MQKPGKDTIEKHELLRRSDPAAIGSSLTRQRPRPSEVVNFTCCVRDISCNGARRLQAKAGLKIINYAFCLGYDDDLCIQPLSRISVGFGFGRDEIFMRPMNIRIRARGPGRAFGSPETPVCCAARTPTSMIGLGPTGLLLGCRRMLRFCCPRHHRAVTFVR